MPLLQPQRQHLFRHLARIQGNTPPAPKTTPVPPSPPDPGQHSSTGSPHLPGLPPASHPPSVEPRLLSPQRCDCSPGGCQGQGCQGCLLFLANIYLFGLTVMVLPQGNFNKAGVLLAQRNKAGALLAQLNKAAVLLTQLNKPFLCFHLTAVRAAPLSSPCSHMYATEHSVILLVNIKEHAIRPKTF